MFHAFNKLRYILIRSPWILTAAARARKWRLAVPTRALFSLRGKVPHKIHRETLPQGVCGAEATLHGALGSTSHLHAST
jgi:hypothetical protein